MPRLTIYKKPYGDWANAVWMKVEFSAPKLVFGNNFEELDGSADFNRVIDALFSALGVGRKLTMTASLILYPALKNQKFSVLKSV